MYPPVDRSRVGELLRNSMRSGLDHLEDIAGAATGAHGQDTAAILGYLRDNLHFVLGERDLQGIEAFHKLCMRYNLIPASAPARALAGAPI